MDVEYMSAWVLFEFMEEYVKWNVKYNDNSCRPRTDGKDFMSFGVCGDKLIHGDIEYFYGVYEDRIVVCDGDLEIIDEIYYGVCEHWTMAMY